MYAWEEKHHRRLATLWQEHHQSSKSARRFRCSFNALLIAWGVYMCVMPFLRSLEHIAVAASVFLLFALQFIIVSLLDDDRPRSAPPSMRFSSFHQVRLSGELTNLIRKEKPDVDKPIDYDKLNAECEAVRRSLMHASQKGHLDPIGMSAKDEKSVSEHIQNLSNVCSKIIVYMHSMKRTRQDLFS